MSGNSHSFGFPGSAAAAFGGTTVGSYDTIFQPIATQSGQTYTFSYWLENGGHSPNDFRASWNGTVVSDVLDNGGFQYSKYTFQETSTSSNTTVQFAGYHFSDFFYLDDVSVTSGVASVQRNWMNSSGGTWQTGGNWSGGFPPGSSTDASFSLGSSAGYTVNVSADSTANNLIVNNDNVTLNVAAAQTTAGSTAGIWPVQSAGTTAN